MEEQDSETMQDSNYWRAQLALAEAKERIHNIMEHRQHIASSIVEKYKALELHNKAKMRAIKKMYHEAGETLAARQARKLKAENQRKTQEQQFYQKVQDDITEIMGQTRNEFIEEQGLEHLVNIDDEAHEQELSVSHHSHMQPHKTKSHIPGNKTVSVNDLFLDNECHEEAYTDDDTSMSNMSPYKNCGGTVVVEDVLPGDECDGEEITADHINIRQTMSFETCGEHVLVEDILQEDECDGVEIQEVTTHSQHTSSPLNPHAMHFVPQPHIICDTQDEVNHCDGLDFHIPLHFDATLFEDDIESWKHEMDTLLCKVAEVRCKAKYAADDPRSADVLLQTEMHQLHERINNTSKRWVGRKKGARKQRESLTTMKIPHKVKDTEAYIKVMESRKITDYVEMLKRTHSDSYFQQQDVAKKDRPILHQWHGDPVSKNKPDNILRLCLQNGNGLYTLPEKGKVHLMSEAMLLYDINFLGLTESHLNISSPETVDIQDVFNSYHPGGLTHHTNTKVRHQLPTKTQQGGVSTFVDGNLATKYNRVEHDPLGRWQCINILTRESMLKIYTVYRVCKEPTGCTDSAYQDQERELNRRRIEITPDQHVVQALKEKLEKDLDNKCKIIVMADAKKKGINK